MKLEDINDYFREKKEKLQELTESEYLKRLYAIRRKINAEIESRKNSFKVQSNLIKEAIRNRVQLSTYRRAFFKHFSKIKLKHLLAAPFIYGMIIPAIIFHICLEIFHKVTFYLCGIPYVSSDRYIIIDRIHLSYLNPFEKFNCVYCGYFNGLMGYAREIAGRTERYWCPIKHARRQDNVHAHYDDFFEYLDGEGYREGLAEKRKDYPKPVCKPGLIE